MDRGKFATADVLHVRAAIAECRSKDLRFGEMMGIMPRGTHNDSAALDPGLRTVSALFRVRLALWSVTAFLLGALFWQIAGFWDEVGGTDRRAGLAHVQEAPKGCTTLTRDPVTGTTVARPCLLIIQRGAVDFETTVTRSAIRTAARLDLPGRD